MRVCVSYGLLPSIGADVPAHSQSPLMRETTVLCEVVCGAEPAEAPNWADFAGECARPGETLVPESAGANGRDGVEEIELTID